MKTNVAALMVLALLAGCSSSTTTPTPVTTVEALSGDGQTVAVTEAAGAPLVVKVLENGIAVSDVAVWFSSRLSASFATVSNTDASGVTETTVTAGTTAGTDTLTASTSGVTTSGTFILTILPGAPDTLRKLAGDGQIAAPGAALGYPLVIDVKDKYFNNVEDAAVTWTTTGGSLSAAATSSGAGGITQVTLTLPDTPGITRVTARVAGADPVTFLAEAR